MGKTYVVVKTVGQAYYYRVEATTEEEAIEAVKTGNVVTAHRTEEAKPDYFIVKED